MTQSRSTPIRGQSNRESQPDPLDVVADTHRDRNEDQPLSIAEELVGQGDWTG